MSYQMGWRELETAHATWLLARYVRRLLDSRQRLERARLELEIAKYRLETVRKGLDTWLAGASC